MPESRYKEKPTVTITEGRPQVQNDQEVTVPEAQPAWERNLKRGLAMLVATATVVVPILSPTSDAVALKVCAAVIGFGAALGITSSGNPPKR